MSVLQGKGIEPLAVRCHSEDTGDEADEILLDPVEDQSLLGQLSGRRDHLIQRKMPPQGVRCQIAGETSGNGDRAPTGVEDLLGLGGVGSAEDDTDAGHLGLARRNPKPGGVDEEIEVVRLARPFGPDEEPTTPEAGEDRLGHSGGEHAGDRGIDGISARSEDLGGRCCRGPRAGGHHGAARRAGDAFGEIDSFGHPPHASADAYPGGMALEFHSSATASLGIELELGLVDLEKGDLVCSASEVLAELGAGHPEGEHPKIKHELFESTVEVITGICTTVAEARADLAESIRELDVQCAKRGIGLVGLGLHPFSNWHDLTRSPGERYERLVERIAWPARRLMTHGMHIHVGVRSGEKAIATVNTLSGYLPIFLALSASSPHWHGQDTGLASARTKVFEAMPTTGLPPYLANWTDFNSFLDTLIAAGSIETVREVWWDIRPHPGFGTVELRMCDATPTLREAGAMAALAQCLVQWCDDVIDSGESLPVPKEWVRRENKWRATRFGVDADLVIDDAGATRPLRQVTTDLVADLMPIAERLDCVADLQQVIVILNTGASYERQRDLLAGGATLEDLVAQAYRELQEDLVTDGSATA